MHDGLVYRCGSVDILDQPHTTTFRDGTTAVLYPVDALGAPVPFLRALLLSEGHWLVFDTRRIAPVLSREIPLAHSRDIAGLISMTLRLGLSGREALLQLTQSNYGHCTPAKNELLRTRREVTA